jgi:hypothetical protein
MLSWNLARHAISEELTVYPAMEKWLGEGGKALTKDDFAQRQAVSPPTSLQVPQSNQPNQVKIDLYVLHSMNVEDPKFASLLEQLM